ncbi:MAG TPA: hypothetical protein GX531_01465 [Methanothermobacter sp.]|nr:hypothetical protein [Methanothermobacter sp.]
MLCEKLREDLATLQIYLQIVYEDIDIPKIIDFSGDPEKYDGGSYQHKFHIHMFNFNSDFWKDHLIIPELSFEKQRRHTGI